MRVWDGSTYEPPAREQMGCVHCPRCGIATFVALESAVWAAWDRAMARPDAKPGKTEQTIRETFGVEGSITAAYRDAVCAPDTDLMFTLAYEWQDKPHRLVLDLCAMLDEAQAEIATLRRRPDLGRAREMVENMRLCHSGQCLLQTGGQDPETCICGAGPHNASVAAILAALEGE